MITTRNVLIAVIFLTGIVGLLLNITHETLWNDEACTALLLRYSYPDLINNLRSDFHPPLYFLVLKTFTIVFGKSVLVLRMFSVFGLIALALLGLGPVKRLLGIEKGILFIFLCFFLPISVSFAQEARMYTWACFLITGMVLYGYLSIKHNQKKDWFLYSAFSIGATYTHIYGLIIFLVFCCVSLFWLLSLKRGLLKRFFLYSGITLTCYLPWLIVTLSQVTKATQNPWYVKTSILHVLASITILFTDRLLIVNNIPILLAIFVAAYFIYSKGIYHAYRQKASFPLMLFGIVFGTLVSTAIFSFFITPILMPRYAFTVFGLFLISIIYGFSTLRNTRLKIAVGATMLLFFLPERIHVHANRINGPLTEVQEYLQKKINPTQVFVHSTDHTFTTFAYYFPNNEQYLYEPRSKFAKSQFTSNGFRGNDWISYIRGKEDVWIINTPATHEDKYVSGTSMEIANLDSLGYERISESDTFKVMPKWYPGRKYTEFEVTPYWFQIYIHRFVKNASKY